MNITAKILASEEYKNKYFSNLKALDSQKNMFMKLTEQINENAQKKKKSESKKKKSSDVMVNGATSKNEIARLQRVLMQKIAEVIAEDDDQKLKSIKVNNLQRKLEALERILSQIEQLEREQQQTQRQKKKKGLTEAVHLTSDDLTVKKSGLAGVDVSVSATSALSPVSGGGVDLIASFETAMTAQAQPQNVDVQM